MKSGKVSKHNERPRRSRRLKLLREKMLSASGASSSGGGGSGGTSPMTADNAIHDFLTTGRTGRRNALPDILGEHASDSTADLPEKLEALTCSTNDEKPGTSGQGQQDPRQQQQPQTSGGQLSGGGTKPSS